MGLNYTHHLSELACKGSALVKEAWYNNDLGELMVKFHGTTDVFVYGSVPLGEWHKFVESDSLGHYYNKYIKGSYPSFRSLNPPTFKQAPPAFEEHKAFENSLPTRKVQIVLNDNESRFTVVAEVVKMVSKEVVAADVAEALEKFNHFIAPFFESEEESVEITVKEVTQHFND